MLIWCVTLFCLGVVAFMDSLFNYGDIFRRINSIVFMLVSLGLLIRTSAMLRTGNREKRQPANANSDAQEAEDEESYVRQERSAAVTN